MIKFLIVYGIMTVVGLIWIAYEAKHAPLIEDDTNEPIDIDFNLTMEDDDWKYLL